MSVHTCSRLWILPFHLQHFIQVRLASTTSSNPPHFPYPRHHRPTPHQIFHLPFNASQQDIKARCKFISLKTNHPTTNSFLADYDLVRAHHPDSQLCRKLSPEERHA